MLLNRHSLGGTWHCFANGFVIAATERWINGTNIQQQQTTTTQYQGKFYRVCTYYGIIAHEVQKKNESATISVNAKYIQKNSEQDCERQEIKTFTSKNTV